MNDKDMDRLHRKIDWLASVRRALKLADDLYMAARKVESGRGTPADYEALRRASQAWVENKAEA